MERKNKIRILKEFRSISALAKTTGKCVSFKNKTELENKIELENRIIPKLRK